MGKPASRALINSCLNQAFCKTPNLVLAALSAQSVAESAAKPTHLEAVTRAALTRRLTADPAQLRIMGNGRQTKSYLHVDDALDAIWVALRHPAATWNVAGRGVTTVMEVAHLVRQALELDSPVECEDSDRGWPGDVRQCAMDGGRLAALGWQASMTSSEAVSAAVAWARAHGGSVRG